MVLSLHKQHFVTAHFQFITVHFVRHCALKNALPPTFVENVAFVCTTIILHSRPNWYALVKCESLCPVSTTAHEICVVYEVYEILR